ncbi:hypothetical protein MRX96_048534 [Rhipicephalus microplus]
MQNAPNETKRARRRIADATPDDSPIRNGRDSCVYTGCHVRVWPSREILAPIGEPNGAQTLATRPNFRQMSVALRSLYARNRRSCVVGNGRDNLKKDPRSIPRTTAL